MVRRGISVVACLLMLALDACAELVVQSNVTTFHSLSAADTGKKFIVLPTDEQRGRVEFRQYARLVAIQMQGVGFVETAYAQYADYVVFIDYGTLGSQTITNTMPVYGQTGGGTVYHSGTVTTPTYSGNQYNSTYSGTSYQQPTYGIVGTQQYSRVEYTRGFAVGIADLKRTTAEGLHYVYEGKALSVGRVGEFSAVAGCLIKALFTDSPGISGKSRSDFKAGAACND